MFEFWLHDKDGIHDGTTTDFLEVVCEIAQRYSSGIAGKFVEALTSERKDELPFLRMIEWKFTAEFAEPKDFEVLHEPDGNEKFDLLKKSITVHKVR